MGKYKYYYHPDDDENDFRLGNRYRGKVKRIIVSQNNHPRAIEVDFPDGKTTIVHKKSFDVSETAIDFYPRGASILIKKVGYMADRRVTKWVIINPLKYDLYNPEGIRNLLEMKRQKAGDTSKYQSLTLSAQKEKPSIFARLKGAFNMFSSS